MSDKNLEDNIRESAEDPKSVSADGMTVQDRDLREKIAADKYLASKQATQNKHRGLRFNKIVPPGAS